MRRRTNTGAELPSTATPAATGDRALPGAAAPATPSAPVPPAAAATPAAPPSIHVRAVITWLAIFPLVAIGLILLGPVVDSWHPVLRAFVLTLFIVPVAVYLVVPQLMRAYGALRRRAAKRTVR